MRDPGFGVISDIEIGIIGAFLGTWLLAVFGIFIGGGLIAAIINTTIGAIMLAIHRIHQTDTTSRKACILCGDRRLRR